jgi:hypothetical protein
VFYKLKLENISYNENHKMKKKKVTKAKYFLGSKTAKKYFRKHIYAVTSCHISSVNNL